MAILADSRKRLGIEKPAEDPKRTPMSVHQRPSDRPAPEPPKQIEVVALSTQVPPEPVVETKPAPKPKQVLLVAANRYGSNGSNASVTDQVTDFTATHAAAQRLGFTSIEDLSQGGDPAERRKALESWMQACPDGGRHAYANLESRVRQQSQDYFRNFRLARAELSAMNGVLMVYDLSPEMWHTVHDPQGNMYLRLSGSALPAALLKIIREHLGPDRMLIMGRANDRARRPYPKYTLALAAEVADDFAERWATHRARMAAEEARKKAEEKAKMAWIHIAAESDPRALLGRIRDLEGRLGVDRAAEAEAARPVNIVPLPMSAE
jgi:hypothetical protein